MIAYEVAALTKRYRPDQPAANDGISLTVYQGEVLGLLGPNGAGKTTLVRQLAGLSRPSSGQVRLFGRDLVAEPALAGQWIALQPQGQALPTAERPQALLEITGQLRGLPPAAARHEALALIDEFGLAPHLAKPFYKLSGGLRRLVSIATALIGQRPVLIFDEPTNDLDPEVRRTVWRRIREAARGGAAVLLVTHNVTEAEQVLDRVGILAGGKMLALGTPGELKSGLVRQVRLELAFRPDDAGAAAAGQLLQGWPEVHHMGARRWAVTVPQSGAERAISRILPSLALLDDFRIVTPNLEDLYLALSGGELLAG